MKPEIRRELRDYIEQQIIPRYRTFDRAHNLDHVRAVIDRSLTLAADCEVNAEMVYTIAAYHDTGLVNDPELRRWFPEEEIRTMREAVEDHRASSDHAPRSIYGRIVAEADRQIDPETVLRRTIQYSLAHYPELDREGHFARCTEHLRGKYAEGGYLRLWIVPSENARRLDELRRIINDAQLLRDRFDHLFDIEIRTPGL